VRGELAVALTLTVIAALKTFDLIYITPVVPRRPHLGTRVRGVTTGLPARRGGLGGGRRVTLTVVIFVINLAIARVGERGNR